MANNASAYILWCLIFLPLGCEGQLSDCPDNWLYKYQRNHHRRPQSNILVYPAAMSFNSRYMNMNKMVRFLLEDGHNVSMVISSHVMFFPTKPDPRVTLQTYNIPNNLSQIFGFDEHELETSFKNPRKMIDEHTKRSLLNCKYLLKSTELIHNLKNNRYDLLFVDILEVCSRIIIQYLDIPTMLYSNFGYMQKPRLFYPQNPAFVPAPFLAYTDSMTFIQRLINVLDYFAMEYIDEFWITRPFTELRNSYGINVTLDLNKVPSRLSVVLINSHHVFDYPRPHMPHVIPMAGIFLEPAKKLDHTLEKFIESSGSDGVIIMSFGSLLLNMDNIRAQMFIKAFNRLPQKVVWRYGGPLVETNHTNIMTMPWIPQNDLLAHPKVKLFITHCGISASYEAMYHAVPVVAVPLTADQFQNAGKLVHRVKMGVMLDYHNNLHEDTIENALKYVLRENEFQVNAQRASKLLQDNPVSPKNTLLFWANYTIRHNGAPHLQSTAALNLRWHEYFLIDVLVVIGFLLCSTAIILCFLCKWIYMVCCHRSVSRLQKKIQ